MRTQRTFVHIGRNRRVDPASLWMALLAVFVIAGTAPAAAGDASRPTPIARAPTQDRMVGVFSGQFVNGIPLYRLPSISVSANRKGELAKIEREEHLTRAQQAKARAAARPPA